MQKLKITGLFLVLATMLVSRSAFGFALGGPIGNGGDSWQQPIINYGVPGDLIVAPKNIGEEYRRIAPTNYYAYDANFLGFFGAAGTTNIDEAFAIINSVGDVDSYTTNLSEWPTVAKDVNFTANALGLTDLKSEIMGEMMAEQMGLVSPERYTWTLHDRFLPPGGKCPTDEEYVVVQRNFDILPSPLSSLQYSPYINGTLYAFYIEEFCNAPRPPQALTIPFAVDEFGDNFTTVAGFKLAAGQFYTGLTRDDVGGLRYLYTTNNIFTEATTPSGALLITTNAQAPQLFGPTLPISILFSQALTNAPDVLATNFPGIQFLSVTTNFVNFISTNISAFFTNQSVPPVFSNSVARALTNGFFFTNQPGPTKIIFDPTAFVQFQTLDLALFHDLSVTDSPATLQLLYPGLQFSSVIAVPQLMFVTNFVTYLTNVTGAPFQGAPIAKTAISSITSFFGTNYIYPNGFLNVFTNHAYTNRTVVTQNIWITNLTGAPFGSPFVAMTNYTTVHLPFVSGDFFVIPTNWCGFDVLGVAPVNILPPYNTGPTNTIVFTGFSSAGAVTNPAVGGNAFGLTQNIYDLYTNFNVVLRPGICEPVVVLTTNAVTNLISTFNYIFDTNVVRINHLFTNTVVTVITTNIGPCTNDPVTLCTTVTTNSFTNNLPSGDFFIVPPGLCNFSIVSTQSSSVAFTTNTIVATNGAGVTNAGQQFSITFITSFTNYTFNVIESTCTEGPTGPALRQGAERVQFVRENFDSLISQFISPITNTFSMVRVTNSQAVTESFQRVITTPDVVLSAQDLTSGPSTPPPFFNTFARNVNFDQSTILTGLAGPGTIPPGITITLSKVGPQFLNDTLVGTTIATNVYLGDNTQFSLLAWGSFDGTTNPPIVYPNGQSLADLYNQIFINVTPSSVPDGTNGVFYSVGFMVSGGSPLYTISAPNLSSLVPGLSMPTVMNTNQVTLSGIPTATGTFNFNVQVTDSVNRIVNLSYPITIH